MQDTSTHVAVMNVENMREMPGTLLSSQDSGGIQTLDPPGWHICRYQADSQHRQGHYPVRERIPCLDTEEKPFQNFTSTQGYHESQDEPRQYGAKSGEENHIYQVTVPGAQCHADPHFSLPGLDTASRDPENTRSCKNDSYQAEDHEQNDSEVLGPGRD